MASVLTGSALGLGLFAAKQLAPLAFNFTKKNASALIGSVNLGDFDTAHKSVRNYNEQNPVADQKQFAGRDSQKTMAAMMNALSPINLKGVEPVSFGK
jgi:hypothetical protein